MRKFLLGLVGCVFLSVPAKAEGSAEQYLNSQSPDLAEALLDGIGTGIAWASTHVESKTGNPIYCQPANLAITPQQHMEILRQYVRQNPSSGK
jgi:hypothetical protein